MRRRSIAPFVAIAILCGLVFSISPAWSGNQAMVEKRVKDLSDLNKQLLSQELNIPQTGRIELKAHAQPQADGSVDLKVYSRKFSTVDEQPIRLEGKQVQMPSK